MFASKDIFLKSSGGYQISRSVRLRSSASAYLNRTFTTPTNVLKWSWSGWVKRGQIGVTYAPIFAGGTSGSAYAALWFNNDNLVLYSYNGATVYQLTTSAVYRDPSAWYHIQIAFDSTQATASNRLAMYVNGVQITTFAAATYPSLNYSGFMNSAIAHYFGQFTPALGASYFDGYLTEVNFIDGQALTPSSFGETNALTGVWQPKRYAGTYGTNGFYLNFSDNSGVTATTIGKDYSGNGNNWTPNNISVTAGTTYDSMLDVPTLWADGGNGRGNYPVWNPLTSGGLVTFTEANLKALSTSASVPYNIESTIKTATTGKWYAEVTMAVGASNPAVGIGNNPSASSSNTDQFTAYRVNGTYITSGMGASSTGTPATFTTNDVIGIAYDVGAGTLSFYKNGTLQTGGFTGITAGNYSFIVRKDSASGDGGYLNCGQRPFSYTPPTGFVALNTQNLPTPTISNGATVMAATLYAANGSTQTISNAVNGISMQPDFVWVKSRQYTTVGHSLFDALRPIGVNSSLPRLVSNLTDAETNNGGLTAFVSNGFSLNNDAYINSTSTGGNMVAWQWNAGGSTVTNTSGSISSQVRANATAGFSVVTYTGTAANATVGHGLGVAPSMIITKNRDSATAWWVYHKSLGNTQYLVLNTTAAAVTSSSAWNNTSPTSTVFSLGAANPSNANQDVAYCFAEVAGYSAFGKYTGNGSTDGPFVFLGFRPRFVLFKRTDVANDWAIIDTARNTFNVATQVLFPNSASAEGTQTTPMDILSNGFKVRNGADNYINANGGTYIYMAFAENPLKLSLAR